MYYLKNPISLGLKIAAALLIIISASSFLTKESKEFNLMFDGYAFLTVFNRVMSLLILVL